MTTEEKAKAYAEKVFCDAAKVCSDKPWNEFRDTYKQAYLAGATEVLASQWKDPKVELPEENSMVIAHSPNGRYDVLTFHDSVFIDELGQAHCVDYWIPIPPLKGGDA